jgi:hypothetical protein
MAKMYTISYATYCTQIVVNIDINEEGDLLKVKVPLIYPSTEGVPALGEGH